MMIIPPGNGVKKIMIPSNKISHKKILNKNIFIWKFSVIFVTKLLI